MLKVAQITKTKFVIEHRGSFTLLFLKAGSQTMFLVVKENLSSEEFKLCPNKALWHRNRTESLDACSGSVL